MDAGFIHGYKLRIGTVFRRRIFAFFHIFMILSEAFASPVWMPQFLSGGATVAVRTGHVIHHRELAVRHFPEPMMACRICPSMQMTGQGRSIRHLPCISRRTGDQGICMFAYTCLKSNGTHLGTCIDRFYFGSCCKLNESNDLLVENNFPLINNNQVTSSYYPSEGITNNVESISVQNGLNKFTVDHYPTGTKLSYPTKTTQKMETSTSQITLDATDKTIVDLAQHLATETYFLMPTTEKIYIPVHISNANGTEGIDSPAASLASSVSGSNVYGDTKRPATSSHGTHVTTSTQPYLLSTFQVVHNEGDSSASTAIKGAAAASATTANATSNFPVASSTAVSPTVAELVSTWTSTKQEIATFSPAFEAAAKPSYATTTKKPSKPLKPYATTRKPSSKKPTIKPTAGPTSTTRPLSISVKTTSPKPTTPSKKPTQPTKKPSGSKPLSTKPATITRPPSVKPTTSVATTVKPPTTLRPMTISSKTTTKPTSSWAPTTGKYPAFSTYLDTTSEVVFTKPGLTTIPTRTPSYGITTFRPDLGASSLASSVSVAGSATLSHVAEGVKGTTVKTSESTTPRLTPTKPSDHNPTLGYEVSLPHPAGGGIIDVQGENNLLLFQQVGTTARPASSSPGTTEKPADSSVPFFPDSGKPQVSTQWVEMVHTSSKPETSNPPLFAGASNTSAASLVMTLLEGLNQTDYMQVCGRRIYPQARVVGGEKSTFGKWPWQISLRQWRTSTYLHKCGAALLNENWAITAAHCVENVPPSDLLLRLGEHDLSTEDEPFGFQERRVQIVASHPQFDPRTFEYDLALLRFYEPVKFQPNIIPVCVPEDDTNFVGQTAYVTGWGRLYEDGPLPSVLQEVSVPVINNTLCENMYRSAGYIEHIPEIFICAGWKKGGFDSCEGDSGGPMVIQRPDKRWLLAGVISWGIGCAEPNQPGVYTRISEFREWIHQILQF